MKRFLILLIAIFSAHFALAQKVSFDCQAPFSVINGQRFQVQFNLHNAAGDFVAPTFEGLDVISGPTICLSQLTSVIGGVVKNDSTTMYTYIMRSALNADQATISSASIMVAGIRYSTDPVVIKFTKAAPRVQALLQAGVDQYIADSDIFMRMEVSDTLVCMGDEIVSQLKIYHSIGLEVEKFKLPSFCNFKVDTIQNTLDLDNTMEIINGKSYSVQVMCEWILYPQKTGVLTIDSVSTIATVLVEMPKDKRSNNGQLLFNDIFSPNKLRASYEVTSLPVKIKVKPRKKGL